MPGLADYSATKAARRRVHPGLGARDLGAKHITVNTVQPGPIQTDMLNEPAPETAEFVKKKVCLGRYGKPEEVAAAVAFLASPEGVVHHRHDARRGRAGSRFDRCEAHGFEPCPYGPRRCVAVFWGDRTSRHGDAGAVTTCKKKAERGKSGLLIFDLFDPVDLERHRPCV